MAISSSMSPESSPAVFVDHEGGFGLAEPFLSPREQESHNKKSQKDSSCQTTGATFARTCFNGLNALSGVGLLSIPYALASGGWLSLFFLFLLSAICCYTGVLLQLCMNKNPNIKTYPDIGDLAFGHSGRVVISIFMYLELYLVATGFLILAGDNLDNLLPGITLQIGTLRIAGKQLFMVLSTIIVLPTTWLRSMGLLAFISAGGVLASVVVVCAVLSSAISDVGFHERGRLVNLSGLPTAMGLYAFCYCGHAVFPTLSTSMKDKSKFSEVLVVCFILCTINYASMAIMGYLMYGDKLQSQVTLNLPVGKISSKIAIYTTLINPLCKYSLMIAPIASAIEETMKNSDNKRILPFIVRTLIVLSTVIIALGVPFFGYLMAFIGSFLSVMMSILVPCICYLKIFKLNGIQMVELVRASSNTSTDKNLEIEVESMAMDSASNPPSRNINDLASELAIVFNANLVVSVVFDYVVISKSSRKKPPKPVKKATSNTILSGGPSKSKRPRSNSEKISTPAVTSQLLMICDSPAQSNVNDEHT
ncbi:hypothetical protein Cni_G29077 [Canna indica]|uniref:Amino acid transporter transmembrane domain-containing protein n=1 Tax=Canna indica TaxID=4628 RepID=A0AAQ3L7N6_9LILI|nr:hypothetical protein Cni_G29077 [Canna indica]